MNKIKALFATALVSLGLVGVVTAASPAEAAISCSAARPSPRTDGSWDLLNTYTGRYTGKPFSFRLKMAWSTQITDYNYKTYTYIPTPRSVHTGRLHSGRAIQVETWYAGTKCRTWTGSVASR